MAKIKFATTAEGVKFYPITIANAVAYIKQDSSQVKLSEFLDSIDYSGKADKVSSATNGNFAGLDANGNLTDSGYKAADFQAAGSYKTTQTAVTDPTASGNATSFIDTIAQDTNGVITATKKTIPNASPSTSGVGGTAGLMSAADKEKLDGVDYSGKADKVASATSGNFAGLDGNGNLTDSGSKAADFATAAQGAKADTAVQSVSISGGTNNGTIKLTVDGTDTDNIGVTGLGSAAYEASTAFDAAGAAAAVLGTSSDADSAATVYGAKAYADTKKSEVIGTNADAASANTIYGAKAYADSLVAGGIIYKGTVDGTTGLPTTGYKKGDYYKVAADGTYAGHTAQVGDALIANKDYVSGATASADWDLLQGSVAVSSEDADLVIGTLTKIATVEGTEIKVKQVEDMTKIEAVAVADTTEYADVTSLFTAPAGE